MPRWRASDRGLARDTQIMRTRSEMEIARGFFRADSFDRAWNEICRARSIFRTVLPIIAGVFIEQTAKSAPDFSREVRPLLEKHCFKCHGAEKQKGGLRFDIREGAFKIGESGEKAIVPGQPSQSRLIKLVSSKDEGERMPSKGEPLSAAQIDVLTRWVQGGAEWVENASATSIVARAEMVVTDEDRKHWSYLPLRSTALPQVTDN